MIGWNHQMEWLGRRAPTCNVLQRRTQTNLVPLIFCSQATGPCRAHCAITAQAFIHRVKLARRPGWSRPGGDRVLLSSLNKWQVTSSLRLGVPGVAAAAPLSRASRTTGNTQAVTHSDWHSMRLTQAVPAACAAGPGGSRKSRGRR